MSAPRWQKQRGLCADWANISQLFSLQWLNRKYCVSSWQLFGLQFRPTASACCLCVCVWVNKCLHLPVFHFHLLNIVKQIMAERHIKVRKVGVGCIYFQRQTVNTAALFSISECKLFYSELRLLCFPESCVCVWVIILASCLCVSTVTTLTSRRSLMVYNKVTIITSLIDNVHRHMCFLQ